MLLTVLYTFITVPTGSCDEPLIVVAPAAIGVVIQVRHRISVQLMTVSVQAW